LVFSLLKNILHLETFDFYEVLRVILDKQDD